MFTYYKAKRIRNGIPDLRWIFGSVLKNMMKDSMNLGQKAEVHSN